MGGLLDQLYPMICGGQDTLTNQCYKYKGTHWQPAEPMVEARAHFTGVSTPSDASWPYSYLTLGSLINNCDDPKIQFQLPLIK